MDKGRLEAFSDGVMAVIITIMVLELKPPHGVGFGSLKPVVSTFLVYVVSFVNVGIYWNNHHHMFAAVKRIDGRTMWATSTCYSGYRFCPSLRAGLVKITSQPYRPRSTASCSSWSQSRLSRCT